MFYVHEVSVLIADLYNSLGGIKRAFILCFKNKYISYSVFGCRCFCIYDFRLQVYSCVKIVVLQQIILLFFYFVLNVSHL
jgi:hypothetical protein